MENIYCVDNKLLIIFAILIFLVFLSIYELNKFIRLKNKIRQSKSSIDVYLMQRFDLIPNLVECVKAYSLYEEKVLTEIASLRVSYNESKDLEVAKQINSKMMNMFATAEANPNLKANEQFLNLQKNLEKMESQLQAARRLYNGDVTVYNTCIETIPGNIFAKIYGFEKKDLFEVEEYKKGNIKVDL